MLRGVEKWITYLVLAAVVILGVVLLSLQIETATDLRQSLSHARGSATSSYIMGLHHASVKAYVLTFFALCLLVMGIHLLLKNIDRAYEIAEVKEKVRYHLKGTTPGIVLVILGTFILAFSAYRNAHLETLSSSQLLSLSRQNNTHTQPERHAPSRALTHSDTEGKLNTSTPVFDEADKHQTTTKPFVPKTTPAPHVPQQAKRMEKKKTNARRAASLTQAPEASGRPVSARELGWAKKFQRQVVIYGYLPTAQEERRYSDIMKRKPAAFQSDDTGMTWAFRYLQKTKNGYKPAPGELVKYESIVRRNVTVTAQVQTQTRDL